jgi:hypothetical protein
MNVPRASLLEGSTPNRTSNIRKAGVFHPIPHVEVMKAGSLLDGPEFAEDRDLSEGLLAFLAEFSGTGSYLITGLDIVDDWCEIDEEDLKH